MQLIYPQTQLPVTRPDAVDPDTLRAIASICRDGGIGMRFHYDSAKFRYPLAASFVSRGAGAPRL